MRKTKVTRRLSLRAKFKSSDAVEVVIMDEYNNIQMELIPIRVGDRQVEETLKQMESGEITPEAEEMKGGSK